jgi:hypothetical protein
VNIACPFFGAGVALKLRCKHPRDIYDKSGDRWMQCHDKLHRRQKRRQNQPPFPLIVDAAFSL